MRNTGVRDVRGARHRASRRFSALLIAVFVVPGAAAAQAQASLGLGVATVRYPGGANVSAAAVSPTLRLDAPSIAMRAGGTAAVLGGGVWSGGGGAELWAATPAIGAMRVALHASGAGTARTDALWTAALHGVGELVYARRAWGFAAGAGPSWGWIENDSPVTALHLRGRAWSRLGPTLAWLSVEPTRFLGAWFTDASAGVTLSRATVDLSVWASARLSRTYDSRTVGGARLQYFPVPPVALELSGGRYLRDPYQGLPEASYLTAGVRLFAARRAPAITAARATAAAARDSVTVRFRMDGAKSLAIAGDWTGWQPRPLRHVGAGLFEGAFLLAPGRYRFALLVDDREWVLPAGVPVVTDDRGRMRGELVVELLRRGPSVPN